MIINIIIIVIVLALMIVFIRMIDHTAPTKPAPQHQHQPEETTMMTKILTKATVMIDNSIDRLDDDQWQAFCAAMTDAMSTWAYEFKVTLSSPPHAQWQSACWYFSIKPQLSSRAAYLRDDVRSVLADYRQSHADVTVTHVVDRVYPPRSI